MRLLQSHNLKFVLVFKYLVFVTLILKLFIQSARGYLNINQYCKAFDENFRPIICLIKNGTGVPPPNHNPHHPPPHNHQPPPQNNPYPILQPPFPDDSDYEDDDCSCEVTCVPIIINQRSFEFRNYLQRRSHRNRKKRTTSTSYRCRSCGAECPVATSVPPRCNCVIPTSKAECNCSVTCAMFRYDPFFFPNRDDVEDVNCIISVTHLEDWRLGEERPPYSCECQRSKESEHSRRPDFVCICQRIPRD